MDKCEQILAAECLHVGSKLKTDSILLTSTFWPKSGTRIYRATGLAAFSKLSQHCHNNS